MSHPTSTRAALAALIVASAALAACQSTEPPKPADAPAPPPATQAPVVKAPPPATPAPRSTAMVETVREAQEILNKLGFDAGTPDGIAGRRTMSALRAFQKQAKLPQTGRLDPATAQALGEKR